MKRKKKICTPSESTILPVNTIGAHRGARGRGAAFSSEIHRACIAYAEPRGDGWEKAQLGSRLALAFYERGGHGWSILIFGAQSWRGINKARVPCVLVV